MKNLVILASGEGTTFEFLHAELLKNQSDWQICGVITDRPQAAILGRATRLEVPAVQCISVEPSNTFDERLCNALKAQKPDLILLAGYLRLIGPKTVQEFSGRIINSHPSLLPRHCGKGMFGRKVHQAVFDAHEAETGVTIHYVNKEYDAGKILRQVRWIIPPNVNVDQIEAQVKALEKQTLLEVILNWGSSK